MFEFSGTGLESVEEFDANAFEIAYADSINVSPDAVNVTKVHLIETGGIERRSLLQSNGSKNDDEREDPRLEVGVEVTTEDELVVEEIEETIIEDKFNNTLSFMVSYDVFPKASSNLGMQDTNLEIDIQLTYICSVHDNDCGGCLVEPALFMGGEVQCAYCSASRSCVDIGGSTALCASGYLEPDGNNISVCDDGEMNNFVIIVGGAAGGGAAILFVGMLLARKRILHLLGTRSDDGSGVVNAPDLAHRFDDIAANLNALPEEEDGLYQYAADPNLLPPILAAYGPTYGNSEGSSFFFDPPKEEEGSTVHQHIVATQPNDDSGLEAII